MSKKDPRAGITSDIETITPAIARAMLAKNVGNRVIREYRVEAYSLAIRQNQWMITGEGVTIDREDNLINGQHRLLACIEADMPFDTVVTRGVDPAAYKVTDSGLGRTQADAFRSAGIAYATQISASAKLVVAYVRGAIQNQIATQTSVTRLDIDDEVVENAQAYQDHAIEGSSLYARIKLNRPAWIAFRRLLTLNGYDDATVQEFVAGLLGVGLAAGDPRLAFRNWLMNRRGGNATLHLAALIRTFNLWRRGENRAQMKPWQTGTPYPVLDKATPLVAAA